MTSQSVIDSLTANYAAAIIQNETTRDGMQCLTVSREALPEMMLDLRDSHGFGFLTDLCGIHFDEPKPEQLGVIYHLHNLQANVRIRLKVLFPKSDPTVASMVEIWKSANWQERETFDFYGIQFVGHPNLTRILNIDDMDFHPLLKEYPLEEQTRNDKLDYMFGR